MIPAFLLESWRRRKMQAFPSGAVTFHLAAWSRGSLSREEREGLRGIMTGHAFSRVLILHGNALEVAGETVVVVGPPGIGKSTASRRLVRAGAATLVEDGLVLVGEKPGEWRLVETGTLSVLHRAARVAGLLRRAMAASARPDLRPREAKPPRPRPLSEIVVDDVAFKGGILLSGRHPPPFAPRLLPISRVELFESRSRAPHSYATDGEELAPVADPGVLVPPGVALWRHSSNGPVRAVCARVESAILGHPRP